MYRYTFLNLHNGHVFLETSNLQDMLNFYHKVPRRLTHDLAIQDNETGELVRIKYAKKKKTERRTNMFNENVIARAGTKEALERFEVLKAMNLLARFTNNEEFYYNHWIYIVPDEADDEELLSIATDDVDTFNDAVACFLDHWDEYALDGGLYIGKTVHPVPDITKCRCTNDDI